MAKRLGKGKGSEWQRQEYTQDRFRQAETLLTTALPASVAIPTSVESAHRRELYFFTLYRVLQAALLVLATFGPLGATVTLHHPMLARTLALSYLVGSVFFLLLGRRSSATLSTQVAIALAIDITVALLAKYAIGGVETGVSLLLLVNIGASSVILSLRSSLAFAIAAAAGTIGEFVHSQLGPFADERSLTPVVMYSVTYLAISLLCHLLGRQVRESAALADQRGVELASLSQLNELIIRRMRTGVLVVDSRGDVRLMNEASWMLLGEPKPDQRALDQLSGGLHQRWKRWRSDQQQDTGPLTLVPDRPLVSPHFAKLTLADELFVIFLDDSALVSRRAEELTLSTLGRLSASIAHEIRNPLAAIHHAGQLLEESTDLPATDQRLVEIIVNHCGRMNDIVENVLALSRRERSRPESIELVQWVQRFVDELKSSHFLDRNASIGASGQRPLHAVVDPRQLHQVVSALVQNAQVYGRMPNEQARITISARQLGDGGAPVVEVIDRGPGVPASVAANIFEPFYTTSEYGSGLGLYIARQLCEANQAQLDYVSVGGGGSCFRITLARAQPLRSFVEKAAVARVASA